MSRYTDEQKWVDDSWFIELDKDPKLMWFYLYETCEVAGIKELSLKQMKFLLSINDKELLIALWKIRIKIEFWSIDITKVKTFKEFEVIVNDKITNDPDFVLLIYIKKFFKHQKIKKLSTKNPFHKGIFLNIIKYIEHIPTNSTLHDNFKHLSNDELKQFSLKLNNKKLLLLDEQSTNSSTVNSSSSSNSNSNSKKENTIAECAVNNETLKIENLTEDDIEIKLFLESTLSTGETKRIISQNKTLTKELAEKNLKQIQEDFGSLSTKKGLYIHSLIEGYEIIPQNKSLEKFKPTDLQKKFGNWILKLMNWVKKQELERITQENYQILPPPEKEMFEENPIVEDGTLYHEMKRAIDRGSYIYKPNYKRDITTKVELFFEKRK